MTTRVKEPDVSDFITTKQAAEMWGVSQVEVQKAIKKNAISAQKIGYFYVLWKPGLPSRFPAA